VKDKQEASARMVAKRRTEKAKERLTCLEAEDYTRSLSMGFSISSAETS
jgi:hypothetical protein